MNSCDHLSDFFKSDFLFDMHFSVVICDFLVRSSWIAVVLVHVSFGVHDGSDLVDKGDSCLVSCPPSWDDRGCSCGHQLYPSEHWYIYYYVTSSDISLHV